MNSYKWAEPIFRILPISALYSSLGSLSFGVDSDGNAYYKIGGADTEYPFSSCNASIINAGGTLVKCKYVVAISNPGPLKTYTFEFDENNSFCVDINSRSYTSAQYKASSSSSPLIAHANGNQNFKIWRVDKARMSVTVSNTSGFIYIPC